MKDHLQSENRFFCLRASVWGLKQIHACLLAITALAPCSVIAQVAMVKDINPSGDADVGWLTVYSGKLYFEANDGVHGDEVWSYDANTNTAVRITDINTEGDSGIAWLTVFDGSLYFEADPGAGDQLWRYNSTSGIAELVHNGHADELTVYQDLLYFSSTDATNGRELWRYDPDTNIASLVANIRSGSSSSSPNGFTVYNDRLYFSADDGNSMSGFNAEPWSYDANTNTAELVEDLGASGNSIPRGFTVYEGKLYFAANGGEFGSRELWRYDSVTDVTEDVTFDFGASMSPVWLVVYNGMLYFQGSESPPLSANTGEELWRFDATDDSNALVADIVPGGDDSTPSFLHEYNGAIYFFAQTPESGVELWRHDATTETTEMVEDINPGANSSNSVSTLGLRSSWGFTEYAGQLYFDADDGTHGNELWRLGVAPPSELVFADGFEN